MSFRLSSRVRRIRADCPFWIRLYKKGEAGCAWRSSTSSGIEEVFNSIE